MGGGSLCSFSSRLYRQCYCLCWVSRAGRQRYCLCWVSHAGSSGTVSSARMSVRGFMLRYCAGISDG
ncbi:hypothetical protein FKM82_029167 [Ascaphus truei]